MRVAAEEAGLGPDELEAVEGLIELLPPDRESPRLGRLMFCRLRLRTGMGLDRPDVDAWRAVVAVTARFPDSVEHALSTAMLADEMLTAGNPKGVPLAAEALELAEMCGDGEAIAEALVVRVYAKLFLRQSGAEQDAARAWQIASRMRRFTTFRIAVYATANSHLGPSREIAGIFRRGAEELAAQAAPHSHIAEMCAWEASNLLRAGDWLSCRRRLRVALGARPGPRGDVVARLTAAGLAGLQGRRAEAEGHLVRAEEVFGTNMGGLQFVYFDETRARVALAAGDPQRAFGIAVGGLDRHSYVEEMLPIAVRALAEQADASRDAGRDPGPVLAALAEFRRRYPTVISNSNGVVQHGEQRAWQAWADAETARATRDPAELARWRAAADACSDAELPWDEAYARWRQAVAALRERGTHRDAPDPLRRAHRLATDLAAQNLLTDLERLARSARIALTETESAAVPAPDLPGLTRREREVLGYLLAGSTNAEIAKALVLSDKTIGVHISNMLRKTGTANRVQLAELARRRQKQKSEEHSDQI